MLLLSLLFHFLLLVLITNREKLLLIVLIQRIRLAEEKPVIRIVEMLLFDRLFRFFSAGRHQSRYLLNDLLFGIIGFHSSAGSGAAITDIRRQTGDAGINDIRRR